MSICMACGTTHDCQSAQHIMDGWRGEKSEVARLRAHSAKLSEALGVAVGFLERESDAHSCLIGPGLTDHNCMHLTFCATRLLSTIRAIEGETK